jgi:TonB family protein
MLSYRALTLSLAIHVILGILLALYAPKLPPLYSPPVVVDLIQEPELARRPHQVPKGEKEFVRAAPIPEELKTKEKRKARFASEEEQYVLQEQQARQTGLTANRADLGLKSPQKEFEEHVEAHKREIAKGKLNFKPNSPLEERRPEEIVQGGIGDVQIAGANPQPNDALERTAPDGSKPLKIPSFVGVEQGSSTIGEMLPEDVRLGNFTALNTDRHLFYTFYARMEEAIRGRWIAYVKAVIYNFENGSQALTGKENWTTELEVILDPDGTVQKEIVHSGSGNRALDSAPVQAFRDAHQFPHPPPEMVKSDGLIHIWYAFTLNYSPRYAGRAE